MFVAKEQYSYKSAPMFFSNGYQGVISLYTRILITRYNVQLQC